MKNRKDNFIGLKATDKDLEILAEFQERIGEDNRSEALRKLIRSSKGVKVAAA